MQRVGFHSCRQERKKKNSTIFQNSEARQDPGTTLESRADEDKSPSVLPEQIQEAAPNPKTSGSHLPQTWTCSSEDLSLCSKSLVAVATVSGSNSPTRIFLDFSQSNFRPPNLWPQPPHQPKAHSQPSPRTLHPSWPCFRPMSSPGPLSILSLVPTFLSFTPDQGRWNGLPRGSGRKYCLSP